MMADQATNAIKTQAVIEILVISEIMTVLAASAVNTQDMVPSSWMTFLGCAVGNAADRLTED
jgi:lipoprotein signal peptidase